MLRPGLRRGLARIFIPDDLASMVLWGRGHWDVLSADGRAEQVDPAIAVEVPGADGPRLDHLVVDDVSGPLVIPTRLAGVPIPGDQAAGVPRNRDIQLAVAVQVGQNDVIGPRGILGDHTTLPRTSGRPAIVGEPNHVAIQVVHDDHIGPAIAGDVADGVPLEPAGLALPDDVPLERATSIVLEPVEGGFPRARYFANVRGDQVDVAVAVDVRGGQPVDVAAVVLNDELGESNRRVSHCRGAPNKSKKDP